MKWIDGKQISDPNSFVSINRFGAIERFVVKPIDIMLALERINEGWMLFVHAMRAYTGWPLNFF